MAKKSNQPENQHQPANPEADLVELGAEATSNAAQPNHQETMTTPAYDPNFEPVKLPQPFEDERMTTSNNTFDRERSYSVHQTNGMTENKVDNGRSQDATENWRQSMQIQSDPEFGATQGQAAARPYADMESTPSGSFAELNYGQMLNMGNAKYWLSLLGGLYLAIYGLKRSLGSLTVAGAGLGLIYYAWTGKWPLAKQLENAKLNQSSQGAGRTSGLASPLNSSPLGAVLHPASDTTSTKNIIVRAPLTDAYQAWANFENFPNFMHNIKSVIKTGDRTSHWVMTGPLNTEIEWDAETTRQEENKRIAWSSINGDIKTSGQVTFNPLPNNEVEVTVMLKYVPPAGLAGEIVAELFSNPEGKLQEDLRNFKRYLEARPQPA